MFELITNDHRISCNYYDTRLFLLCPDDGGLHVVSYPEYCREGFSVLVSQTAGRTIRTAEDVAKYGHRLSHRAIVGNPHLVNKRGKLDFLRDGRVYFGLLAGTELAKKLTYGWGEYIGYKNILGAEVEITQLELLSDSMRNVYVVSAPARFATNTWTMSLLTGLARSVVKGGSYELGLDINAVDFLFEYVNEVKPSKYKNLRSYQWSSSFGVNALWRAASTVAGRYYHGSREDIDSTLRRVLFYKSVAARAEVLSLLQYIKAKGRNDLIDTTNIPL